MRYGCGRLLENCVATQPDDNFLLNAAVITEPKVCLPLRLRASIVVLCVVACLAALAGRAPAQIALAPVPVHRSGQAPRAASDATPTSIALDLCVHGSTLYACPADIVDNDTTYYPEITYVYGQSLDGVIRVGGASTGTITVLDGTTSICVLNLGAGGACPASATDFNVGTHVLTGTFTPVDPSLEQPSTSQPVTVTVTQDAVTGITLSSSLNPAPEGTAVTFTANVAAANDAVPTGQVTFQDGNLLLKSVALDANGNAAFATSTLTVGTHEISVTYSGAQNFLAAPSPASLEEKITPVVVPLATATTLSSSVNPSVVGENVNFTAEVQTTGPFIGSPSGAVTFRDGTTTFATVVLTAGIAKTSISTLAAGTHNVTALYSGDASTASSTSQVLVQQVNYPLTQLPPGYTITVTPSPVTIGVGLTARLAVTVTPVNGFSAPVTLTCSNLPNEGGCTFAETTIPAGGGTTTLDLTTMAPHDCGSSVPYFVGSARPGPHPGAHPDTMGRAMGYGVTVLAGAFAVLLPRRRRAGRRWGRGLLGLVTLFVAGSLLLGADGCSGHCTDFGTTPGNYTFKVNGTSSVPATPVDSGASAAPSATPDGPVNVTTSVALTVKL